MTVINTNYSTLEEAWGGNFVNKSGKKKKSRYVPDPLCDLYAKKNLKSRKPYGDDGVDDGMYALYNKNASSRSMLPQVDSVQSVPRASKYKPINVDGIEDDVHDAQPIDDDDAYLERYLDEEAVEREAMASAAASASANASASKRRTLEAYDMYQSRRMEADMDKDKLIDLGLYISSGILMIFTMEQILQLGMRMGASS